MQIFSGNSGYAGFYGPSTTGNNVSVMISRASGRGGNTNALANEGFLADTYNIQWGRSVSIRRVFNNSKPIAIVGYGQGTVTLRGLIGTVQGFQNIVGASPNDENADICDPLLITIENDAAYNKCTNNTVSQNPANNAYFDLTGCLLSNIVVTGQIESQSGAMLQQADITFSIGGFTVY